MRDTEPAGWDIWHLNEERRSGGILGTHKGGIDYFSFDVDFFEDRKIEFISARFGIKGELITVKLLCRIYRNGYFLPWSDDEALLFAKRVGALQGDSAHAFVNDVVHELVKREFFDKSLFDSFKILTSRGIQKRYITATKRRAQIRLNRRVLCLNENDVYILNKNVYIDDENVYIEQQRKVKESKVKKKSSIPPVDNFSGKEIKEKPTAAFLKISSKNKKEIFERIRRLSHIGSIWQITGVAFREGCSENFVIKILERLEKVKPKKPWGLFKTIMREDREYSEISNRLIEYEQDKKGERQEAGDILKKLFEKYESEDTD